MRAEKLKVQMINNELNILILSVGRRVELVNCFKAARDRLDVRGKVCGADISRTAPALQFCDERYSLPRIGSSGYIDRIIEICSIANIALVVPTIDTELEILAENKEYIEKETNAKLLVSNVDSVAICCNKIRTAIWFEENGFGYPKVITKQDIENKNYSFPLFIKPLNGSSSVNAFKINNEKELLFFNEYIKEPIIQECILGKEYTIDCFLDFSGNPLTIVPRERLATRGGEVLKGRIEKNQLIINDVLRLVKKLNVIGQITVQCILTETDIKYIEINPRFGGGAPMSIAVGADSCEKLYRLLLGEKLEYSEDYRDGTIFARFDNSVEIK